SFPTRRNASVVEQSHDATRKTRQRRWIESGNGIPINIVFPLHLQADVVRVFIKFAFMKVVWTCQVSKERVDDRLSRLAADLPHNIVGRYVRDVVRQRVDGAA